MFFRQVLHQDLGCASYVVGGGGQALVVDPRWEIDVYVEIARVERLRITHVLDTHDHADHVSGLKRLAALTGARALRAARLDGDPESHIGAGQEIALGEVRVRALPTPGHRPEHLALTVTDLSRAEEPWLVLSGDSLLVGDLARPDLAWEARAGAAAMHDSLRMLLELGDHVELWPGHVGGSLCGGAALSTKTSSTIGFEGRHNPLLAMDHAQFVAELARSLPPRPPSVERIVALNRAGADEPPEVTRLSATELRERLQAGVTILDGRSPPEFDAGHLSGAINLPLTSPGLGTRAGWLFGAEEELLVVAADAQAAAEMVGALHAVGHWSLCGYVVADPDAWRAEGLPGARAEAWDVEQLARALERDLVELVDVRDQHEWVSGHVTASRHMPLHRLREAGALPDPGRPIAVACMAGGRAAFAASVLRRAGTPKVIRVAGGGVPDLATYGITLAPGS